MTRVLVYPYFRGADKADGGIRRVVEAQLKWLPKYGIVCTDNPEEADVAALHAGTWIEGLRPETPIVAHSHGLYWAGYQWHRWAIDLNKDVIRTMRQADVVTAPSEWVAQALRRNMGFDAIPLHHGIEPEHWLDAQRDPKAPAYVLWNKTRVDPICDPTPLNELAKLAPDVQFVSTFGDEADNTRITGALPYETGLEFVRNASVYMATTRETFGIGTLEAMAAGVPVLGWKWGGQVEFVKHRKHGYLANPDDYEDLERGLRYCLKNRDKLGKAAREFVLTDYTNEQRMKPYAELYHRLAEQAREKRPKVSVVITNYNLGEYLTKAVTSVVSSSLKPEQYEVVIVDDASTEPLPERVEQAVATHSNVQLIRNPQNLYLAGALNVGVEAARGQYILPLDADNMVTPWALEVLSGELDKDRTLDIAYGKMEVIREGQDTFVSDWPPKEANLEHQLLHRNQISSTAMYRRRLWERVGGYRRRCHTAEDADYWTRCLSLGAVGRRVTEAVTLQYRDRSDSMSHTQKDWPWHEWYKYAREKDLRLPAAGGDTIWTHEFPWVSVIIPVGPGHDELVLDALDSVQNQSLARWEVLVINDTGRPLKRLPAWARVFNTKGRQGAATARNIGLDNAKGGYVLFLDADDYLHHNAIQLMYDTVRDGGGFAYSDWYVAETGEQKFMPDFNPGDVLRQLPYPVTCMYDTRPLKEHKVRFDTSLDGKGWEDWDFSLQAIVKAGMCGTRIEAPLFHYRLSTGKLREKAYADSDNMKSWVYAKWKPYIEGEVENMAGGCGCGARSMATFTVGSGPTAPTTQADPSSGQVVTLEYIAPEEGARSFAGRMTGTRYMFGFDSDSMQRMVYVEDAPGLMSLGLFRQVSGPGVIATDMQPMMALGAPRR